MSSQGSFPSASLPTTSHCSNAHSSNDQQGRTASAVSSTTSQADTCSISSQSTRASAAVRPDGLNGVVTNHQQQSLQQTPPNCTTTSISTSTEPSDSFRCGASSTHPSHRSSAQTPFWALQSTSSLLQLPKWTRRIFYDTSRRLSVQISYGLATLAVAIFAAVTAMYFAYKTFVLSRWQAEKDYFDLCMSTTADMPGYERCQQLLKTELPPPPYPYSPVLYNATTSRLTRRDGLKPSVRTTALIFSVSNLVIILSVAVSLTMAMEALFRPKKRGRTKHKLLRYRHHARANRGSNSILVRRPPRYDTPLELRAKTSVHDQQNPSLEKHRQHQSTRRLSYKRSSSQEKLVRKGANDENDVISKPRALSRTHNSTPDNNSTSSVESRDSLTVSSQTSLDSDQPPQIHRRPKGIGIVIEHVRQFLGPRSASDDTDMPIAYEDSDSDHGEYCDGCPSNVAKVIAHAGGIIVASSLGSIGMELAVRSFEEKSDMLHSVVSTGTEDAEFRRTAQYQEERNEVVFGEQPRRRKAARSPEHI